ncbi:hypothetical protein NM63023_2232, partial [Neisseria meningitidis 63023]
GAEAPSESVPYYLYCLRLRRLVLIFVNPLYFERNRLNLKQKCRLKGFQTAFLLFGWLLKDVQRIDENNNNGNRGKVAQGIQPQQQHCPWYGAARAGIF